jgi:hypothetical protein
VKHQRECRLPAQPLGVGCELAQRLRNAGKNGLDHPARVVHMQSIYTAAHLEAARLVRPVMRAVSSASASSPRSASLTASDVGKDLASVGSFKATAVSFAASLKNFPLSNLQSLNVCIPNAIRFQPSS